MPARCPARAEVCCGGIASQSFLYELSTRQDFYSIHQSQRRQQAGVKDVAIFKCVQSMQRKQELMPAMYAPGTLNMPVETPFEDLEMRSLLSRSNTYGRLYSASWRGAPVAVKVRAGACSSI